MKGSRCDEQDVVGTHHSVAGVDCGSFDNWQDVTLDSLSAHFGSVLCFSARDLIDFVDEDNARFFNPVQSLAGDLVNVDQLRFLLHDEIV